MTSHSSTLAWKIPWTEEPGGPQSIGSLRVRHDWATSLSLFTFILHFHALEKEMATHSSVLAWRIPGTGEPGGLPSLGSRRVGHDWSDLAAAAVAVFHDMDYHSLFNIEGHLGCFYFWPSQIKLLWTVNQCTGFHVNMFSTALGDILLGCTVITCLIL